MASVELRGLTKHYGSLAVVDDVSLTIEHGRLVCLLGPSGLRQDHDAAADRGLRRADRAAKSGSATGSLSSPSRTVPPERRNMSMIFQSYALWPHMTVAQNVVYGLKLRKVDKRHHRAASSTRSSPPRSSRDSPTAIRASCPAASSSASRWRAR